MAPEVYERLPVYTIKSRATSAHTQPTEQRERRARKEEQPVDERRDDTQRGGCEVCDDLLLLLLLLLLLPTRQLLVRWSSVARNRLRAPAATTPGIRRIRVARVNITY